MFRFTIRDVLWLTVVVAMGAGWWAEKSLRDSEWRTVNTYMSDQIEPGNSQPSRMIVEQREKRFRPNR